MEYTYRVFADEARVGRAFAHYVMNEIKETGCCIVLMDHLKEEWWEKKEKGAGCVCLTLLEQQHLLQLRADEPTRINKSYIKSLLFYSGNNISSYVKSSFFKY